MNSYPAPPLVQTTGSHTSIEEQIRARLNRALPDVPYVTDATFANVICVSAKTLANRRALNPSKLPRPIRICGNKTLVHPRCDLLEWLVQEEMRARTITIHRCQ